MQVITSSPRYRSVKGIATFQQSQKIHEIYNELYEQHRGIFIVNSGPQSVYVNAYELASHLLSDPSYSTSSQSSIGQLLEIESGGVGNTDYCLVVDSQYYYEDDDEPPADATVRKVHAVRRRLPASGSTAIAGWYFSQQSLLDPGTRRVVFICGGKDQHRNPDTDHGQCYRCDSTTFTPQVE